VWVKVVAAAVAAVVAAGAEGVREVTVSVTPMQGPSFVWGCLTPAVWLQGSPMKQQQENVL
jgi:hypothetical protein